MRRLTYAAGLLGAALSCFPANSQMSSDNACTRLTAIVKTGTPDAKAAMERYADLCSGSETAGGLICRTTKDLLHGKGEPYRAVANRMQCRTDAVSAPGQRSTPAPTPPEADRRSEGDKAKACSRLLAVVSARAPDDPASMERNAVLCSGYDGAGGLVCAAARKRLHEAGEPFRKYAQRIHCPDVR